MTDSITLSDTEIKKFLSNIDKKYHLEIFAVLKNAFLKDKKSLTKIKKDILSLLKDPNLPRSLNEDELDQIVEVIPVMPSPLKEISLDSTAQVRTLIRRQLSKQKFSVKENTIELIKKNIRDQYLRSAVDGGDSVGVNGAMSIGEPLTQANLNTFHASGSKTQVQGGLKAIEDLFTIPETRKIENTVVHFRDKNLTKEEITNLSYSFMGISVKKLIAYQELMEELPEEDQIWYDNYKAVMGSKFEYKGDKFLRIYLNINDCYRYNISIKDVARSIEKNSRSTITRKSVTCITSGSSRGIIDIHAEKLYIRNMLENYEKTVCDNTKIKKNKLPPIKNLDDTYDIFLSVFLSQCFEEMMIKGIKNIENFIVAEPINLIKTFESSKVSSVKDLEKFSQAPYNLELEDIDKLWTIRIRKQYKLFEGIPEEKYINLFENAGFKILENKFKELKPYFVVLIPEPSIIKYFDPDTKKSSRKYILKSNGRYYDPKNETYLSNYNPKMSIENQLEYEEKKMIAEVDNILVRNEEIRDIDFAPMYRFCYYCYGIAFGKKIIKDILNNKLVDARFTYPDNVRQINSLLGIEASRFYFSNKYLTTSLEEVNPLNMDLLIDFQTASGQLLKITSSGVASQGASIITSVAFQNSMEYLEKGTAMGDKDKVKGISSCIMTGTTCKNGTGIVEVNYQEDYLQNDGNKYNKELSPIEEIREDEVVGPCYLSAIDDMRNDEPVEEGREEVKEERAIFNIPEEGIKSELTIKEKIHSPPRMRAPKSLEDELDIPDEPDDFDIPEEPEDFIDEED